MYAILVALAMVLSYVESQIPVFVLVPGIRLGLTNLVVLIALYSMGSKDALIINVLRIVLVGMTFGNTFSMIYSLAGGILSGTVMILMKKIKVFSMVTVSLTGGICHNIGQIFVAMLVLETKEVAYYLPVLCISGIVSGILVGLLGAQVMKRLPTKIWE